MRSALPWECNLEGAGLCSLAPPGEGGPVSQQAWASVAGGTYSNTTAGPAAAASGGYYLYLWTANQTNPGDEAV